MPMTSWPPRRCWVSASSRFDRPASTVWGTPSSGCRFVPHWTHRARHDGALRLRSHGVTHTCVLFSAEGAGPHTRSHEHIAQHGCLHGAGNDWLGDQNASPRADALGILRAAANQVDDSPRSPRHSESLPHGMGERLRERLHNAAGSHRGRAWCRSTILTAPIADANEHVASDVISTGAGRRETRIVHVESRTGPSTTVSRVNRASNASLRMRAAQSFIDSSSSHNLITLRRNRV